MAIKTSCGSFYAELISLQIAGCSFSEQPVVFLDRMVFLHGYTLVFS